MRLRGVLVYALMLGLMAGLAAPAEPPKDEAAKAQAPEKEPRPETSPRPNPSPTGAPPPRPSLRLNLEEHVEKHVEREKRSGTPRFEERVEVDEKTPQGMLERHYQGLDLECGGLEGGAPTEVEMRAVRPHTSPSIDFLPLLGALRKAIGKRNDPRFFLYRITRQGKVSYDVRPDRVPGALLAQPGVQFELLEGFSDLDDAKRALLRMEHGFDRPVPSSSASPPPPWVTAQPCRPK